MVYIRKTYKTEHTCVVELPREAQVEGEVGDLRTQLSLSIKESLQMDGWMDRTLETETHLTPSITAASISG